MLVVRYERVAENLLGMLYLPAASFPCAVYEIASIRNLCPGLCPNGCLPSTYIASYGETPRGICPRPSCCGGRRKDASVRLDVG